MRSISVTDRDGVVVLRAPEGVFEDPIASGVLTTIFSMTAVQSEKVNGLGAMNTILNIYSGCYLLQAASRNRSI